jgi:response regulator RpfG family c-di-GMP phosphodiesterase
MTLRVLIVDDEPPIRRLLQNWVEAEGAAVMQASTSEEALSLISPDTVPAVALCDIRLPGKDGLWLATKLRVDHPETAVVMTTGVNEFDVAVNSIQAGVVDYLVKPFTRERLTEALQRGMFAHSSRRALATMQRELETRRAQISEALAELEVNASTSLEVMLEMLRARDAGSHEHANRVSRLAVNLAMTLEIGEPRLSDIERAALLHDLGRLALPDELLLRREASFSDAERERFRAYPLHGQAILRNVPYLAAASELAVAAHERFDGSGFPHGLRGDQIPLGARIIGVANAYDELVYGVGQIPVSAAQALDVICTTRAPEFDPLVLGALRMLVPGSTAV